MQATTTHYVRTIVPDENRGSVSLDENAIDSGQFMSIGLNSCYSSFEQRIAPGTHTVSSPEGKFSAVVYGYGNGVGYGFVAGLELLCVEGTLGNSRNLP